MSLQEKGNFEPRLVEGTEITLSVDGDSATAIYRGEYIKLRDARPKKGEIMKVVSEYGEWEPLRVVSTKLRRDRAGLGTLTVNLAEPRKSGIGNPNKPKPPGEDNQPTDPNIVVEVNYTIIEKPLKKHPMFKSLGTENWVRIASWMDIPIENWEHRMAYEIPFKHPNTGNILWVNLGGLEITYCKKIAAGIEAYYLQVPVVRQTTTQEEAPTTSLAGKRDSPPVFEEAAPAWLKTADSAIQRSQLGAWERVEEWTGFDELDDDLYPKL